MHFHWTKLREITRRAYKTHLPSSSSSWARRDTGSSSAETTWQGCGKGKALLGMCELAIRIQFSWLSGCSLGRGLIRVGPGTCMPCLTCGDERITFRVGSLSPPWVPRIMLQILRLARQSGQSHLRGLRLRSHFPEEVCTWRWGSKHQLISSSFFPPSSSLAICL